ncbi:MAG: FAD-dependent oxidoreductase [Oscillibacter sp.]|nr:FAD-dependent oxidoreductase [Oscillibacter sp.]
MDSIWMDTALPAFPPLEGDRRTDVLIIGGGMAGVLCAYFLTQAGVDCLLIESDRVGQGVTGRTTAKITAQHGLFAQDLLRRFGKEKARLYLEANLTAVEQYRRLAERIPCGFEDKDSFVYSLDHPEKLEKELRALAALGHPGEPVRHLPLPFSTAGAVKMAGQAQFHPLKFLAGLLPGLPIYEHTAARAFHKNTVLTGRGSIRAKAIIVATHFPILNKHGAYFLKLYQHRSYVLALEGAQSVGGMYVDEAEKGLSFRDYGEALLLGGGDHRTGKEGGGWAELKAFARVHYPDAEVRRQWATQDCMSLDAVPYIGPYSKNTPGLYVAAGFNKWGMTGAMVSAMVLTDLVQGKQSPYGAVFDPGRSMLHLQLAVNGFESAMNLLRPTTPRCPHMGCALRWNPREHTWDCPCHGSRFTEEGKLLENPATGDLKN